MRRRSVSWLVASIAAIDNDNNNAMKHWWSQRMWREHAYPRGNACKTRGRRRVV